MRSVGAGVEAVAGCAATPATPGDTVRAALRAGVAWQQAFRLRAGASPAGEAQPDAGTAGGQDDVIEADYEIVDDKK